jgi:hypothetical protein
LCASLLRARNAKAAVDLLTPMEIEPSYSASIMKSYMVKNLDLGYDEHFSQIASSDHVLPKAVLHKLLTNIGGETTEPINVSSNELNYLDEEQNIYSANTQ